MEHDDEAAAVYAALASHPWQRCTSDRIVRLALAARDRHRVDALLTAMLQTSGTWDELRAVEAADLRVAPLAAHLDTLRWSELTLDDLVEQLLEALDRWWFRWQWRLGDEPVEPSSDDV